MSYHHKIPCKYWGKRKKKIFQKLHNLNLQANTDILIYLLTYFHFSPNNLSKSITNGLILVNQNPSTFKILKT